MNPPSPLPPSPTVAGKIAALNARFRRPPDGNTTGWESLADQGIALHQFDNWELPGSEWRAKAATDDPRSSYYPHQGLCAVMVHRGQLGHSQYIRMPLWGNDLGGLILRPGATPLLCAKGMDGGGFCTDGSQWAEPLLAVAG